MTIIEAFRKNLTQQINDNNVNICEMSRKTKISHSNMYLYMRGEAVPRLDTAWKIAEYLGVGIDDLTKGATRRTGNIIGEIHGSSR